MNIYIHNLHIYIYMYILPGTMTQSVIGVPESEEKVNEEKSIWGNKSWILSRFGKEHSFTDSRNSENPKQNTLKESHI